MIFNSTTERFIFYNLPVILFSLIPFFLITGPFLSDLSISLISLLFLIYCLKRNDFSFFKNKFFYFFFIFWFYLIFNSLINNFNINSLGTSLVYCRYGIFVIAILALLNFSDVFIKYFFYCILICFVILILDGFYQYFNGENILGWKNYERTSSFFGKEKILGSYLSRLWPIFFGISILIYKSRDKIFIFCILIFILSEALIFLSGDRTAFFNINLSAIFVILFSQRLLKLRLLTLLLSFILLTIISLINPTAKERVFDDTISQMNLNNNQADRSHNPIYIFSEQHTHHYITAYRMYLDNKILGVGVKNFRNFCDDTRYIESNLSCSTHPHNTYIQILSETGLIGFFFLLIAIFYFMKYIFIHGILKFKGSLYFNDFEVCLLSGILIYLFPFIPTGNVFNNWLNIIMMINIPIFIWSRQSISN